MTEASELLSDEEWEAAVAAVNDALVFSDWAAGEGISPIDPHIEDPEAFLARAFDTFGSDGEWDQVTEAIIKALSAERAARKAAEKERDRLRESNELLLAAWEEAQGEVASIHETLDHGRLPPGAKAAWVQTAVGADRVFAALCRNWPSRESLAALSPTTDPTT